MSTPAADDSTRAVERTAPAGAGGTPSPAAGGTGSLAAGGTASPAAGGTASPAAGGTASPTAGGTASPAAGGAAFPAALASLSAISIAGPDARTFLQGQLSNDLRKLTAGRGLLATCNSAQGRVQAVMTLVQRGDSILAIVPASVASRLAARLRSYVLRSKVAISEASDLAVASLTAANARRLAATPPSTIGECVTQSSRTLLRWWGADERYLLITPRAELAAPRAELATPRAELAAPRAELAAPRPEPATQRAELAAQRAEPATQRAELAAPRAELAAPRAELAAQRAELAAQRAELAMQPADPAAQRAELAPSVNPLGDLRWRRADIAAGVPQVYPETHELFVAQMLNIDLLGGISFDKGCYTGQEIIARTHYRGTIKRRMLRFTANCAVPAPGTRVLHAGSHCGEVVDACVAEPESGHSCELLAVVSLDRALEPLTLDGIADSDLTRVSLPYGIPQAAAA